MDLTKPLRRKINLTKLWINEKELKEAPQSQKLNKEPFEDQKLFRRPENELNEVSEDQKLTCCTFRE